MCDGLVDTELLGDLRDAKAPRMRSQHLKHLHRLCDVVGQCHDSLPRHRGLGNGVSCNAVTTLAVADLTVKSAVWPYCLDSPGVTCGADRHEGSTLQRAAWQVAMHFEWPDTYAAEYIALTRLQADAFVTLDPELARTAATLVPVAPVADLLARQ